MGSINEVIEAFRKAPTKRPRGAVREVGVDGALLPAGPRTVAAVRRGLAVDRLADRNGKTDTGIDLVARGRDTGEYTPSSASSTSLPTHPGQRRHPFVLTASGKKPFTNRVIISTTDKWGKNAADALEDQSPPECSLSADCAVANRPKSR